MFISHLTVENFGGIVFYDAPMNPKINLLQSDHPPELSAAIAFLLCSEAAAAIPEGWIREETRLSGCIVAEQATYHLQALSVMGQLQLTATNLSGEDTTAVYRHIMRHCPEQDATERFDGRDKTLPYRLCRYCNPEENRSLSRRTQRFADTQIFRNYLQQYIHSFRSEPINSRKAYRTTLTPEGKFTVYLPGASEKVYLSETERTLFYYICYLNIAEFWAHLQQLRDLHHQKKPLVIQNFLEFLDESANIRHLLTRTQKLNRQVIILTRQGAHNAF